MHLRTLAFSFYIIRTRRNAVGIQMLNEKIHSHLFPSNQSDERTLDKHLLVSIQQHLRKHHVGENTSVVLHPVDIDLPELSGTDIDEHFRQIGEEQSAAYKILAQVLI